MKIKSTLAIIAGLLVAANGFSQGTLTFANSTSTRIVDSRTGANAANGSVTIGLFYSLDLNASIDTLAPTDSLTLGGEAGISPVGALAGVFGGGTVTIPNTGAGSVILVQVRAWESGSASYGEAITAQSYAGYSTPFQVTLGGGALAPANLVANGLTGFTVTPIPEPSIIAMGVLAGLGGLVLIRRRK